MCYALEMLKKLPEVDIDKEAANLLDNNKAEKKPVTGWLKEQPRDMFFGSKQNDNDGLAKLWNEKIVIELRNKIREQTGML